MDDFMVKMVDHADLPQWFGLSFIPASENEPPAIAFILDHRCAEAAHPYLAEHRYIEDLQRNYKFKLYEPNLAHGFGFDSAARPAHMNGREIEVHFPLDRKNLGAIAASVFVLAQVLKWFPVRETTSNRIQLMDIEPFLRPGEFMYGAPLAGTMSPSMRSILKSWHKNSDIIAAILETMFVTWQTLGGKVWGRKGRYYEMGFYVLIEQDGRFCLGAPGNACDVAAYPDLNSERDPGLRFSCHNLDTELQQLTLIAGLAKMHDLATQKLDRPSP